MIAAADWVERADQTRIGDDVPCIMKRARGIAATEGRDPDPLPTLP